MEDTAPTRKLSVTFERKLDVGNYQNVVARAWLETNLPEDATAADISDAFQASFSQVKAAVYDELGIEVVLDGSGVIREKHAPTVTVTEQRLGKELGAERVKYDTKGIEVANPDELAEDLPDWLVEICEREGITKVWAKNGSYGPFYKEFVAKGDTAKLGLDDRGRTKIIAKPRN